MLIASGVLAGLFVIASVFVARVASASRSATLGVMSDQWLAEHRNSKNVTS